MDFFIQLVIEVFNKLVQATKETASGGLLTQLMASVSLQQ